MADMAQMAAAYRLRSFFGDIWKSTRSLQRLLSLAKMPRLWPCTAAGRAKEKWLTQATVELTIRENQMNSTKSSTFTNLPKILYPDEVAVGWVVSYPDVVGITRPHLIRSADYINGEVKLSGSPFTKHGGKYIERSRGAAWRKLHVHVKAVDKNTHEDDTKAFLVEYSESANNQQGIVVNVNKGYVQTREPTLLLPFVKTEMDTRKMVKHIGTVDNKTMEALAKLRCSDRLLVAVIVKAKIDIENFVGQIGMKVLNNSELVRKRVHQNPAEGDDFSEQDINTITGHMRELFWANFDPEPAFKGAYDAHAASGDSQLVRKRKLVSESHGVEEGGIVEAASSVAPAVHARITQHPMGHPTRKRKNALDELVRFRYKPLVQYGSNAIYTATSTTATLNVKAGALALLPPTSIQDAAPDGPSISDTGDALTGTISNTPESENTLVGPERVDEAEVVEENVVETGDDERKRKRARFVKYVDDLLDAI